MNFAQKLDDENSLSHGTFSCSIQAVIKKTIFEPKMTICGDLAITVGFLCRTTQD